MRALIAWCAFAAGALFVIVDIVRLQIAGLAVLGVVLLIVWLWGIGAFTREFWIQTITEDHPNALGLLDQLERDHRQETDQ